MLAVDQATGGAVYEDSRYRSSPRRRHHRSRHHHHHHHAEEEDCTTSQVVGGRHRSKRKHKKNKRSSRRQQIKGEEPPAYLPNHFSRLRTTAQHDEIEFVHPSDAPLPQRPKKKKNPEAPLFSFPWTWSKERQEPHYEMMPSVPEERQQQQSPYHNHNHLRHRSTHHNNYLPEDEEDEETMDDRRRVKVPSVVFAIKEEEEEEEGYGPISMSRATSTSSLPTRQPQRRFHRADDPRYPALISNQHYSSRQLQRHRPPTLPEDYRPITPDIKVGGMSTIGRVYSGVVNDPILCSESLNSILQGQPSTSPYQRQNRQGAPPQLKKRGLNLQTIHDLTELESLSTYDLQQRHAANEVHNILGKATGPHVIPPKDSDIIALPRLDPGGRDHAADNGAMPQYIPGGGKDRHGRTVDEQSGVSSISNSHNDVHPPRHPFHRPSQQQQQHGQYITSGLERMRSNLREKQTRLSNAFRGASSSYTGSRPGSEQQHQAYPGGAEQPRDPAAVPLHKDQTYISDVIGGVANKIVFKGERNIKNDNKKNDGTYKEPYVPKVGDIINPQNPQKQRRAYGRAIDPSMVDSNGSNNHRHPDQYNSNMPPAMQDQSEDIQKQMAVTRGVCGFNQLNQLFSSPKSGSSLYLPNIRSSTQTKEDTPVSQKEKTAVMTAAPLPFRPSKASNQWQHHHHQQQPLPDQDACQTPAQSQAVGVAERPPSPPIKSSATTRSRLFPYFIQDVIDVTSQASQSLAGFRYITDIKSPVSAREKSVKTKKSLATSFSKFSKDIIDVTSLASSKVSQTTVKNVICVDEDSKGNIHTKRKLAAMRKHIHRKEVQHHHPLLSLRSRAEYQQYLKEQQYRHQQEIRQNKRVYQEAGDAQEEEEEEVVFDEPPVQEQPKFKAQTHAKAAHQQAEARISPSEESHFKAKAYVKSPYYQSEMRIAPPDPPLVKAQALNVTAGHQQSEQAKIESSNFYKEEAKSGLFAGIWDIDVPKQVSGNKLHPTKKDTMESPVQPSGTDAEPAREKDMRSPTGEKNSFFHSFFGKIDRDHHLFKSRTESLKASTSKLCPPTEVPKEISPPAGPLETFFRGGTISPLASPQTAPIKAVSPVKSPVSPPKLFSGPPPEEPNGMDSSELLFKQVNRQRDAPDMSYNQREPEGTATDVPLNQHRQRSRPPSAPLKRSSSRSEYQKEPSWQQGTSAPTDGQLNDMDAEDNHDDETLTTKEPRLLRPKPIRKPSSLKKGRINEEASAATRSVTFQDFDRFFGGMRDKDVPDFIGISKSAESRSIGDRSRRSVRGNVHPWDKESVANSSKAAFHSLTSNPRKNSGRTVDLFDTAKLRRRDSPLGKKSDPGGSMATGLKRTMYDEVFGTTIREKPMEEVVVQESDTSQAFEVIPAKDPTYRFKMLDDLSQSLAESMKGMRPGASDGESSIERSASTKDQATKDPSSALVPGGNNSKGLFFDMFCT
jgi:hypothetical protein